MSASIKRINLCACRRRLTLLWAVLGAIVLNGCLFMLMPSLINRTTGEQLPPDIVPQVNIVRLQERVIPEKVEPLPEKEPKIEREPTQSPKPETRPMEVLSLAFALNPRLPEKPSGLRLPPPQTGLAIAPAGEGFFAAGELDAPLTILARTPPLYPLRARQRGIEGWVRVKMQVNEQGEVGEVVIVEAQPQGVFEDSVRRCVRGWKFQPGTVEGVPVKAEVETTVKFALE